MIAGGDGTINRVVHAVGDVPVPIGIIPLGSGNDLARALGVPRDPVSAAQRIAVSAGTTMDLVEVNAQPCCTVGGIGLVADVTIRVGEFARPGGLMRPIVRGLGPHAYLLMAAARLAAPSTPTRGGYAHPAKVRAGDWRWEGECHALFVANFPPLGAGLALPIDASASDGAAEVCIVPRCARVSLALRLAALRSGRPQPEHVLAVRRTVRAVIEIDHAMPFVADGDVICTDRRFEVVVRPAALTVLC